MPLSPFLQDMVSGTIGGVAGIVVGQPLDTIKVRLQVQRAEAVNGVGQRVLARRLSRTSSAPFTRQYSGILDCAAQTVRREGVRGLFKGVLAPCLANAPINATVFVIHGGVTRWLARGREGGIGSITATEHFLAGSLGGLAQCVFATPNEGVKIRQQVAHDSSAGVMQVARRAVQRVGWRRGLFQGWWLTLARDTPAFGGYFASYNLLRDKFVEQAGWSNSSAAFCSGGVAGMLSFLLLHPVDVLKSYRQAQPLDTLAEETTVRHILAKRLGEDPLGPRFLLRGIAATVLRAGPVSAVIFVVYDRVDRWITDATAADS